jgi:DNA-binding GntR family transcriptional regulator
MSAHPLDSNSADTQSPVAFRGLSKADAAYLELRTRIFDGRLPPGQALNQEQLATELGVSTTPLREALRRLESQGYVRMPAHRDVIVAPLGEREFSELFEVRGLLDSYAARLAAREHNDEDRRALESASDLHKAVGDPVYLNRRFHQTIYRASHNEVLINTLDALWDRSDRYRLFTKGFARTEQVIAEHEQLKELVLSRDEEGAARLMLSHVQQAKALLEQALRLDDHPLTKVGQP